jgi:hypothetical protein
MRSVIVHLVIETLSLMNHYVLSTIKTVIIVFVTRGGSYWVLNPWDRADVPVASCSWLLFAAWV